VGKYDQAFRVINPYYKIYGYELTGMTDGEVELTKQLQAAKSLVVQTNEFHAERRQLSYFKSQQQDELARHREEISRLRDELTIHRNLSATNFK